MKKNEKKKKKKCKCHRRGTTGRRGGCRPTLRRAHLPGDGYARWAFDLGWASGFRTAAGTDWRVDAAERMIKRGRLVLLRWAMRYGGLRCEMANLRAFAAQQGHVAALRILCNRTRYLCWARQSHHLAPIAAYHGRIDILDFLRVQGAIDPKVSLRKAAHKGGAEMVHDWLDTHNIR